MHTGNFAFQVEPAQAIHQEIEPLLAENWASVANDYPASRLNPNVAFYIAAQDNGIMRIFTSRMNEVLVGYAIAFAVMHPHRQDDMVASIETFFIRPGARRGGHAAQFLDYIENELRMMGAVALTLGSRNKRYDRWLAMRGYRESERVWERSLQWRH